MNEQLAKTNNELKNLPEKRVLIIEDDMEMAEPLKTRFESYNERFKFKVDIAMDRNEGINKLVSGKYDVIVIDRSLNGKWSEWVLLQHQIRSAITIIWTAYFSDTMPTSEAIKSLKECMRMGAWDYIPKVVIEGKATTCNQVVNSAVERMTELENSRKAASALSQEDLRFLYSELYKKYAGKWVALRGREPIISKEHYIQLIDELDQQKKKYEEQRKEAEKEGKTPPEWVESLIIKVPSAYPGSGGSSF